MLIREGGYTCLKEKENDVKLHLKIIKMSLILNAMQSMLHAYMTQDTFILI